MAWCFGVACEGTTIVSRSGVRCVQVRLRPDGMANAEQSTGQVEVPVDSLEVLNTCRPLAFSVRSLVSAAGLCTGSAVAG